MGINQSSGSRWRHWKGVKFGMVCCATTKNGNEESENIKHLSQSPIKQTSIFFFCVQIFVGSCQKSQTCSSRRKIYFRFWGRFEGLVLFPPNSKSRYFRNSNGAFKAPFVFCRDRGELRTALRTIKHHSSQRTVRSCLPTIHCKHRSLNGSRVSAIKARVDFSFLKSSIS